jgi:hypothetical protein
MGDKDREIGRNGIYRQGDREVREHTCSKIWRCVVIQVKILGSMGR